MAVNRPRAFEISDYVVLHGDDAACAHFGISAATLDRYKRFARNSGRPSPKAETGNSKPKTELSDEQGADSRTITARSADITSLEELLAYSAVDLTTWEVDHHIINSTEVTTGEGHTYTNYQVKAWLKRKTSAVVEDWIRKFRDETSAYSPKSRRIVRERSNPILAEIDVFDPHVGKLAWHIETGEDDYDLRISEEVYERAVMDLSAQIAPHKPERIIYPVGNDFFHSNGAGDMTAAGTRLDVDGRWQKSFGIGSQLVVRCADLLAQIAPVEIITVQGNHDPETSFYLGEYLSAWYRSSKDVVVDNRPIARKYRQWGRCLIGYTHGDIRLEQLPLLMATEAAEMWASSAWREWRVGHLHHSNIKSFQQETEQAGCRVVMVSSLSPADAWHAKNGFIAQREAQAPVWDRESGKIATYYHRPRITEARSDQA